MAEVTISVPFNGGTVTGNQNNGFCHLTENRYLEVFYQSTPGYVFAKVIGVDNPRAAAPVVTTLRTQTLNELAGRTSGANSTFRLARLNNTTALLVYSYVSPSTAMFARSITIDPVTNVATLGAEVTLSTVAAYPSGDASYVSMGIQAVADNTVLINHPLTLATAMQITKVTLAADGTTITTTPLASYTIVNGASAHAVSFSRIRNTQQWVVMIYLNNTSSAIAGNSSLNSCKLYYGDPASNATWTNVPLAITPYWLQSYVPTAPTTGLLLDPGVSGITRWGVIAGGTLGATTVFSPTALSSAVQSQWATWIGDTDDHIFVFSGPTQSSGGGVVGAAGTTLAYRVIKYVDNTYGTVSAATAGASGGSLGATSTITGYTTRLRPIVLANDLIALPTYTSGTLPGNAMKLLFIKV